ncbi:MAG: F0F1 ATP synthase subunit B [Candidatus Liptonbacteria bacterium]|nr:F0F1 ATP synthase subunit B [Candidatus Liptonbacteria bacterium]
MQELFQQLGIDWRLLTSQAVNFLILVTLLTFLVYKPVLKILKERKEKIEDGVRKSEEAETRLSEANLLKKEKLKEAEQDALAMLRETEQKAKTLESALLSQAKEKENAILKNAELIIETKNQEARELVRKEAVGLVREAIAKTVELSPETIDEVLIKKAIGELKSAKQTA